MQNGSAQHHLLAVTECNTTGNINRKAEKTTDIHYHTLSYYEYSGSNNEIPKAHKCIKY